MPKKASSNFQPGRPKFKSTKLRITSGDMRGRKIAYNGDPATRPMKERTRESVFSLVGGKIPGFLALDLFGGTGILGFEAISRGAEEAVILELAQPAIRTILTNTEDLGLAEKVRIHHVDTLRWMREIERHLMVWNPDLAWLIFCCPPYRMWKQQTAKLVEGLQSVWAVAPPRSFLVCETETDFDLAAHMPEVEWDIRKYSPARVAVARKES